MRKTKQVLGVALLAATSACGGAPGDGAPQDKGDAQRETAALAPSAEDRYLRAVSLLEIERKPAEARTAFKELADDASASDAVRARARIGLARAERLLGRGKDADEHLREVAERPADAPAASAAARAELSAAAGTSARFATGFVDLGEAQCLDLDTGGVFTDETTPFGSRAEVVRRGDSIDWLVERTPVPEFKDAVPWLGDSTWARVTTDGGRAVWIQQLPGARPAAFRFVVRLSGSTEPLPAARDPFCVGRDGAIDVRFTTDPRYVSYRIERRAGPDGAFESKGEIAAPPFTDTAVEAGRRFRYRITGIAANGDEGIAAAVSGTTRSRGVVTGSVDLKGGRSEMAWFDFLEERIGASGDLKFQTSYGGGDAVGFLDAWGRVVNALREGDRPRTAFAASSRRDWPREIRTGDWIIVPLRGGGVARARVQAGPSWCAHLDYEVDPDAEVFGTGPTLALEERASDTAVRVTSVPSGYTVKTILARDPRAEAAAEPLTVSDGAVTDRGGGPGALREYTAVAEDDYGRRSSPAVLTVNRLPSEPREGTFEFHYRQGWSFALGRVVDAADADVVFATCAGGISSITLTAAGGIVSLEDAVGSSRSAPSAERLFEMLLAADVTALKLKNEARCDDRDPLSDVAVLRTRHGGWAKVAIVERGTSDRGWQEHPAKLRFTYNPREPNFATTTEQVVVAGGIRFVEGAVPGGTVVRPGSNAAQRVARSREGVITLSGGGDVSVNAAMEKTIKKLGSQRTTVAIGKSPLADVLMSITMSGVAVEIDAAALHAAQTNTIEINPQRSFVLGDLVEFMAEQAGLAWTIDDAGTVRFVPRPQ